MTNLDPKHLDALVVRQRQIAILHRRVIESRKDTIRGPVSLSEAEHRELIADATRAADAITALRVQIDRERAATIKVITALRSQIDRERAATIEAAAKACEDLRMDAPDNEFRAINIGVMSCVYAIRALHTDATRAAMDAIRREGYEAGVRSPEVMAVVKAARMVEKEDWGTYYYADDEMWQDELKMKAALQAFDAKFPPDPDTNAG